MRTPATQNFRNDAGPTKKFSAHNASSKMKPHKRRGGSTSDATKVKFHSATCNPDTMEISEFSKLDPSIPEHKRRLEQRRKIVSYGKNTIGYDEYVKQVPKAKRRRRNMDTPMTPDHTLDMPNKRWVGQIRAWRRALHNYDPADLQQSLASAAATMEVETPSGQSQEENMMSTQDRELADAKTKGLLVDLGSDRKCDSTSPTSVAVIHQTQQDEMKELDQWDTVRGEDGVFCSDADDSDDDLL